MRQNSHASGIVQVFSSGSCFEPQGVCFLISNLGFGPSKLHTMTLHNKPKLSNPFICTSDQINERMKKTIQLRVKNGCKADFSLETGATKVSRCMSINHSTKSQQAVSILAIVFLSSI